MACLRRRLSGVLRLVCWLLACGGLAAEVRSLTILHTNDLHARLSPLENHNGGFAYVAAAIRHEKEHCADCLMLFAGDLVQGTPVSTIFHGLPVFEIGNLLGFDAATLGNHEFDYGWPQARKFIQTARYPIVTANLENSRGQLFTDKPYVILKVNGLRVAVIGAMTQTLATLSEPKLLEDWHTTSLVETARKYAVQLKGQSDLVVLLGHITAEEELALLRSVPEIPVLVTGHIHRGIEQPTVVDGRIMVRVKSYGEEIGKLSLQVDTEKKVPVEWKWTRITVDSTRIPPAADVAREVKRWEDEVTARVDRPLALSKRAFTKPEVKRMIEQALRDETGADFAWMNQGGVRDTIPEGQLRERHIWNIMPFDNVVLVGTFKGQDLPPAVVGDRRIDPEREYTLAVSDFTAANQSAAGQLATTGLQFGDDVGLLRDLLIDWCRKQKAIE